MSYQLATRGVNANRVRFLGAPDRPVVARSCVSLNFPQHGAVVAPAASPHAIKRHILPVVRRGSIIMPSAIQLGPLILPEPGILNIFLVTISWGQAASFTEESQGKNNMPYGKFSHGVQAASKLSGRLAMVIIYILGVAAGAGGFAYFLPQATDAAAAAGVATDLTSLLLYSRPLLLSALYFLHFFKRELEVVFVQKFSGQTPTSTAVLISFAYSTFGLAALYLVSQVPPEMYLSGPQIWGVPAAVLLGVTLFVVGQAGNGYHHWLLARLRSDTAGGTGSGPVYKVPTGGLFPLVTCPHYFFEIISWLGIAVTSQHVFCFGVVCGMTSYLAGRSIAAKNWYLSKLEDYPKERKYLVPYLF